jgi:hypothetical protein
VRGRTQKNYWPPFVLGSRALNYRFEATQHVNRGGERLEARLAFCFEKNYFLLQKIKIK